MKALQKRVRFSAILLFIMALALSFFTYLSPAEAKTDKVCVVKISGEIDNTTNMYVKRALAGAKKDKCKVVVIEINSTGGDVGLCEQIKDSILKCPAETICFVNDKATGTASIIPLACDKVYMSASAVWGGVQPAPNSTFKASLEALATAKNKPANFAGAMADPNYDIEGLKNDGKSLSMIPEMAMNLNLANGTAGNINEFLQPPHGDSLRVIEKKPTWMEMLSGAVANPFFSIIILALGLCAVIKEILVPGNGVAAATALVLFTIFFGGKFIAGSSTVLAMIIFLIGIVLLVAEFIVFPGFGVTGVLGIGCVGASIVMSFEDLNTGLSVFSLVMILSVVLSVLFFKYISKSQFILDKFAIKPIDDGMDAVVAEQEEIDFNSFLGKTGKSTTDLKPYGKAIFEGSTVDVTTNDGRYAAKDEEVVVIQVEGNKIVVMPVKNIEVPT